MSGEREILQRLVAGPVSGDTLAQEAGLTRAAMWKRIEALRDAGVEIDAQAGRGYALRHPLELLNDEAIIQALAPFVRAGLASLEIAWTLDSTNSELLRRETPAHGTAALIAERQSGGRGRRGKAWISPLAAHLYLSLSRQFSGGLSRLGGLSLVAGVAVAEALHEAGYAGVRLKWPNDLVVEGRKLGGLLVEGGGEHAGPVRAVIGLGLNVRMPDAMAATLDQPWIDLARLADPPPSRNLLAARLLTHLVPALDEFDARGLAPFLARYAAFDALTGQEVNVHLAGGVQAGTAIGIAEDGALRVRVDGEERVFHAGQVSVRTQ
ncbi:MAG: bifunctional biotin--[acetyl-CoA-carboxylase] ligase/biotin operon repressor BirA [Pseudoxanthomonas sp.]